MRVIDVYSVQRLFHSTTLFKGYIGSSVCFAVMGSWNPHKEFPQTSVGNRVVKIDSGQPYTIVPNLLNSSYTKSSQSSLYPFITTVLGSDPLNLS